MLYLVLTPCSVMAKDFVVAVDDWPPFIFTEKEPYRGIDIDLLQEICTQMGLNLQLKAIPLERTFAMMKSGKIDATTSIAKTKEREQFIVYTSPSYYTLTTVFYVPLGKADLIQKYEDLYNLQNGVGVVSASTYFSPFDNDPKIIKYQVPYELLLIKMLGTNRLDAFVGTEAEADYQIIQNGYKGKFEKAVFKPKNDVYLYLGISRKSPFAKEITRFNKIIKQIIAEGKITQFTKKYYQ
jgi:polar amino acid transport system substrate-binding protein